MPVRHPILNGFGRLGLGEAAAKMIDAFGEEQGTEFFNAWNAIKRKGIESCHIKMKKEKEIIKN